jgi:hypothetical protein
MISDRQNSRRQVHAARLVVFEMLSGRCTNSGETITQTNPRRVSSILFCVACAPNLWMHRVYTLVRVDWQFR